MPQKKLIPDIKGMSDADFEAWLDTPKTCTGEITSARGKPVLRSWCNECLTSYYKARRVRLRTGAK